MEQTGRNMWFTYKVYIENMSKVLNSLRELIQDERPLLSLQIVESLVKCPTGYRPVSKTYDEDSDAGLLRQNGLFGKKSSHYICLSKSEGWFFLIFNLSIIFVCTINSCKLSKTKWNVKSSTLGSWWLLGPWY